MGVEKVSGMLEKLEKNKIPILLTEIGAYLHLIGRFSEKFIAANAEDAEPSDEFDYQKVYQYKDFFEGTRLGDVLNDSGWKSIINDFKCLTKGGELTNIETENFRKFIEKHKKNDRPKGLCKILADAHGIVSGIDKGLAGGKSITGKQRKDYTFKSTAFGFETEIEFLGSSRLSDVEENRIKEMKKNFFEGIEKILERIKTSKSISYDDYKNFIKLIKQYYLKTLGETRRPINEITLHDYAHPIACLAKSNLAKIIIDGWYEPLGKSEWRILKVNIDVLGLLSKGLKIGDILGYKSELEEAYEKIKKVVEFEYPLGNEIYRDSTGIYFSCPAVDDIDKLESEIIEKLRCLEELKRIDYSFQIEISDKSRSGVVLAREIEKSFKKISYHHADDMENLKEAFEESRARGEDVCPICRIRLKPENEDRCEKCKDRYIKRTKNWLEKRKISEEEWHITEETIWLDEIADKNDRVALIIGQFDLRRWLSGEFVGTFVSQTFDEWKNLYVDRNWTEKVSDICKNLNINDITDLEKGFLDLFNDPNKLDENWKKICGSFTGRRPGNFIEDFWKPIAERDFTGRVLELKENHDKAKHLIRLLFRKHPSLARISRIWKTTQEFIDNTIFEKVLKGDNWNSELRKERIQFKIEPNPDIKEGSTCDIDIDGVRFSPVCVKRDEGIFVSTINLELLKKFGESTDVISRNLNEKEIKVKTERDKTWQSAKNGKSFKITEARVADEDYRNYLPFAKIYDFPDQFMALVPAYEALDIAEKILGEYERQFAKVRDRLPFHLGIIAFHRRTPLYVAIDAGRRLLDAFKRKVQTLEAKVIDVSDDKNRKTVELKILAENYASSPFEWEVPYSTGDPQKDDLWHPYFRNKNSDYNRPLSFDYTGNKNFVSHVKSIETGDVIEIEPSYFKLLFLEKAADRYRVGDELRPLHDLKRLQELWKEIRSRLKAKTWSSSQIYAFRDEVRRRSVYGSEGFEEFMKANLINILDISPAKEKELFDKFILALKDELLDLCLFWNLQVKKDK